MIGCLRGMRDTAGGFIRLPRGWYGESERHSKAASLGWHRRKTGLAPLYYEKLLEIHQQRTRRARIKDERLRAKDTIEKQETYEGEDSYFTHSWAEQPGRKDIEGIDTPKETKTKGKEYLEDQHKQAFKNRFYDQMNEERRNDKDSLFPLYNALHNLETAKMVNYQGANNSREDRYKELSFAFHDAEKVGRRAEAEKLINEYNRVMGDNLSVDMLEYERTRMPISTMKVIQERKDKEKSLDLAKKQLAKEKNRLTSKELDYKERETTKKMIETLECNIDVLEKDLGFKSKKEQKTDKEKFMATVSKEDIDYDLARNAYRNMSFVPEERARQVQEDYVAHMEYMYDNLSQYAENEQQKEILLEELEEYKKRFLEKRGALLSRQSGLASTMITGPANFPVKQQRKRNEIYDRKRNEFVEWGKKAETIIKRKINKGKTEEERTDELLNDIERDLKMASITEIKGEKVPSYIKTNAKARIVGRIDTLMYNGEVEQVDMILNKIEEDQKELGKNVFTKRHRIWKSTEKAKKIASKEKKEGTKKLLEFSHGEIINNYDDERIQIVFDGKPPSEVRTALKSEGWHWSRKNMAWQRKNTWYAEGSAKSIINKYYEVEEKEQEED